MTEAENPGFGLGWGGRGVGGRGWERRKKEAACYAGKNENAASRKEDKVG